MHSFHILENSIGAITNQLQFLCDLKTALTDQSHLMVRLALLALITSAAAAEVCSAVVEVG